MNDHPLSQNQGNPVIDTPQNETFPRAYQFAAFEMPQAKEPELAFDLPVEKAAEAPVFGSPTETPEKAPSAPVFTAPIKEAEPMSEFAPLRPTPASTANAAPEPPVQPPVYTAPVRPTAPPYAPPTYAPPTYAYTPPVRPAAPVPPRPVPKAAKPPKQKKMGWRIALIALCCTLLGSAVSAGLVGWYFEHYKTDTKEQSAVAQQPAQTTTPTTVLTQPAGALSQIYSTAVPSIVGVTNEYTTYDYFGQPSTSGATGTGFIISTDGEILTNYHVVENAQKLTITLSDGKEYPAELLGYEAESDVALLKIDAEGLTAVKLGNSDALQVGEQIAAIGNPLGELTYTMTVGYVSAKSRAVYTDEMPINMMQIDAAINSGNSGGPLFNLAGEVVGITTAKYSGSISGSANIEGIGFAIPINDVLAIVDDLREYGSVKNRAYIGVTVTNSTAGGDIPAGALVQSIDRNSSGDKAGLRVSDIITAVGDYSVTGIDTLYQALRPYRAGDTVELTVFRSGDTIELTITFDAVPGSETEEDEGFTFPWG